MSEPARPTAFLFRQPILDREQALAGYRLSFRGSEELPESNAAAALCATYGELGMQSALGHRRAFLGIDTDFLQQDAIELLPPTGVVLELLVDEPPNQAMLKRCDRLRDRGYALALTDYRGIDPRSRPLLPMVEVIKIRVGAADEDELRNLAGSLRKLPVRLLAQDVDSHEQLQRCCQLGFELFQGRYFAQGEIVSGRRLSASQLALIRVLDLVERDVETPVIEDAFKHEPALTLNLLRIVNSVGHRGSRLSQPVTSLRHAITLFGRRQLRRWLSLLLFAPAHGAADPACSPLLQVAALRGRMMELLLEAGPPGSHRNLAELAFLTGILSMMPVALGLPIEEILEQIAVDSEVRSALCQYDGLLGKLLALLQCFDNDDATGCDRLLAVLPPSLALDRQDLNIALSMALRWLNGDGG